MTDWDTDMPPVDLNNPESKVLEVSLRNQRPEKGSFSSSRLLDVMKWSTLTHFVMITLKCESVAQASLLRSNPISNHLVNMSTWISLRFLKLYFLWIKPWQKHGFYSSLVDSSFLLPPHPISHYIWLLHYTQCLLYAALVWALCMWVSILLLL